MSENITATVATAPFAWQTRQWEQLTSADQQGRLGHAWLLCGPAGLGKLAFAKQFGQWLLCQAALKQDRACGDCSACRQVMQGTHADRLLIQPDKPQAAIKVDQIRRLRDALLQTSHRGGWQVAVIDAADQMNASAANALLKTLEEPQDQVVLLLVCRQPTALPATVRSRCQQLVFSAASTAQLHDFLHSELSASAQQDRGNIEQLCALSDGAPLHALALVSGDGLVNRQMFFDGMIALSRGQMTAIDMAERCANYNLPDVIGWLMHWVIDWIRRQSGISLSPMSPIAAMVADENASVHGNREKVFHYFDRLLLAQRHMREGIHVQQPLLLQSLFIQWQQLK